MPKKVKLKPKVIKELKKILEKMGDSLSGLEKLKAILASPMAKNIKGIEKARKWAENLLEMLEKSNGKKKKKGAKKKGERGRPKKKKGKRGRPPGKGKKKAVKKKGKRGRPKKKKSEKKEKTKKKPGRPKKKKATKKKKGKKSK
jgi:hypothetical protein